MSTRFKDLAKLPAGTVVTFSSDTQRLSADYRKEDNMWGDWIPVEHVDDGNILRIGPLFSGRALSILSLDRELERDPSLTVTVKPGKSLAEMEEDAAWASLRNLPEMPEFLKKRRTLHVRVANEQPETD